LPSSHENTTGTRPSGAEQAGKGHLVFVRSSFEQSVLAVAADGAGAGGVGTLVAEGAWDLTGKGALRSPFQAISLQMMTVTTAATIATIAPTTIRGIA
jgi:hypothetical protein